MRGLARSVIVIAAVGCGASHRASPRVYRMADLSIAQWTGGLPVSSGTLTVDLSPDVDRGVADWRQVRGVVDFACDDCTLGDDRTPYHWMIGTIVGHLTFDHVRARADFAGGVVRVSASGRGEVDFDVALVGTLAPRAGDTNLDGCVTFAGTERLRRRDEKLASALRLLGYPIGSDQREHVSIGGTLAVPRILGTPCELSDRAADGPRRTPPGG